MSNHEERRFAVETDERFARESKWQDGIKLLPKRACDLKAGDMVDMEKTRLSFPYTDPLAEFQFGVVDDIEVETDNCLVVSFTDLTPVGVSPNQVFQVVA